MASLSSDRRNLRLTLEYDGTRYYGWQRQSDRPTVQQTLEEAASRLAGEAIRVIGSGRTDTGVHAWGQVANFHTVSRLSPETFRRGLNALLPQDVRVLGAREVHDAFHARYDARSKRYVYRVDVGRTPPVFARHYCLHVTRALDRGTMERAGRGLLGRHDFRAFARKPPAGKSTERCLLGLDIWRRGDTIWFALEADGFLHTMVRSIVGTLLEVGSGRRAPEAVREILSSRDRSLSGPPAPPQGLFLMEVFY